jgi:hypothetical protein
MLDPGVVSCGRCLQPNWVPTGLDPAAVECTHCGKNLAAPRLQSPRKNVGRTIFVLLLLAVLAVGLTMPWSDEFWGNRTSAPAPPTDSPGQSPRRSASEQPPPPSTRKADPAPPAQSSRQANPVLPPSPPSIEKKAAAAQPTPVAISDGIVSASKPKNRVVPLQVRAGTGGNYFVRLVNVADEGDVINVFIRGGTTLKVEMPLGTYRLRFASGSTGYGEKLLFGQQTSYWIVEQTVTFRNDRNAPKLVAIDLAAQKGGPMKTAPLVPNRF